MWICIGETSNSDYSVSFSEPNSQNIDGQNCKRISPIYPVNPNTVLPSDNFYILFSFPKSHYSTIGKLDGFINEEEIKLFYSNGLASLILISNSRSSLLDAINLLDGKFIAYELWHINNGCLASNEIEIKIYDSPEICQFPLPDVKDLPLELVFPVREFIAHISNVLPKVQLFFPEITEVLLNYNLTVKDFIGKATTKTNPNEDNRRHRFYSAKIYQINTAISYMNTQALSGIPSILKNPCPLSQFSLLGIGSSVKALTNVYMKAVEAFDKCPIAEIVKEIYSNDCSSIDISINPALYKRKIWNGFVSKVKDANSKYQSSPPKISSSKCHLAYFSFRSSFQADTISICAALQALPLSSTLNWSFVTLSHEFLHAHIRAIFSAIIPDASESVFENDIFPNYQKWIDSSKRKDIPLSKQILYIILSTMEGIKFSVATTDNILKKNTVKSNKYPVCDYRELKKIYCDHIELIDELAVHILDFLYFYKKDTALYVNTIWRTWSVIPEIEQRIDYYLLRTLVGVSPLLIGSPMERFNEARQIILKEFKSIIDFEIIHKAYDRLNSEIGKECLFIKYFSCCGFIDLVLNLFFSEDDIAPAFSTDMAYPIDESTPFLDEDIQNPFAFIRTRLYCLHNDTNNSLFTRIRG